MALVLVVDDSTAACFFAEAVLRGLGVQTQIAYSGVEALKKCGAQMPDAILLDWNMPEMDGPEFQSRLRQLPNGYLPKVIFCSSRDDFSDIAAAISGGAEGFIIKPFNIATLTHHLRCAGVLQE